MEICRFSGASWVCWIGVQVARTTWVRFAIFQFGPNLAYGAILRGPEILIVPSGRPIQVGLWKFAFSREKRNWARLGGLAEAPASIGLFLQTSFFAIFVFEIRIVFFTSARAEGSGSCRKAVLACLPPQSMLSCAAVQYSGFHCSGS